MRAVIITAMNTRDIILSRLYAGSVSGEKLASELGMTRAAVWKVIRQLSAEGYRIRSSRKGYRLEGGDLISEAGVRNYLTTDWTVETHRSLTSTNDRAKVLAEAGADMTAVIADAQLSGRGRLGRTFFSPAGGLYLSAVVRPHVKATECGRITAYAAVAAARGVERESGLRVEIKWVNDLYVRGKKICGILTEGGFGMESGELAYAVIGIGVNIRCDGLPDELSSRATGIENESGRAVDRCRLAAAILDELSCLDAGLPDDFVREYVSRSCVIGRRVTVDGMYEATAEDIAEDCSLILRKDDGEQVRFSAGEVSLKL